MCVYIRSHVRVYCLQYWSGGSPVHRKLHGSSDRRAASPSSPPQSPSGRSDGCRSTALTASVVTHQHARKVKLSSICTHTKSGGVNRYLKIPSLFKDSNHRFVDVSDELVSLWFPQVVHTQLQLLHQSVLHTQTQHSKKHVREKDRNGTLINWTGIFWNLQ